MSMMEKMQMEMMVKKKSQSKNGASLPLLGLLHRD